ncbi:MAG: hypothetical protein OXQ92_04260 [Boseongicola sp.]|nr:hypothetical protein [Boseongicola sp.]
MLALGATLVLSRVMMARLCLPLLLIVLSACTDWPDVPNASLERGQSSWPSLVPSSNMPTGVFGGDQNTQPIEQLLARTRALRARAQIMRRPVNNQDELEALRRIVFR